MCSTKHPSKPHNNNDVRGIKYTAPSMQPKTPQHSTASLCSRPSHKHTKAQRACRYDSALNAQSGFPVFATYIEANNVKRRADDFSLANITEETLSEIQKLAADKTAGERIIDSIAPSIYGHRNIKAAIAMALFGGQEKQVGSHRLRCARHPAL